MLIAIPAFRLSCKVSVDKARAWSLIEEMVLWAVNRAPTSIAHLARDTNLPRQLIVASLARLMRFRLVELGVTGDGARFRTSAFGKDIVESGRSLPFFPKREVRRVSCVIEKATGSFFPAGQVRIASDHALRQEQDPDVRHLVVEGGGPSMSHDANLARLSNIAARGWEEQLAHVDSRTASVHNENILIRVVDGVARNLPESASQTLRDLIDEVARRPTGARRIQVGYSGRPQEPEQAPRLRRCTFHPEDLVIGVTEQRELLLSLLAGAAHRVVIHSTFLDHNRFRALLPEIRAACARGVSFDLLWGANSPEEEDIRNATEAVKIAALVREDRDLARRFRIHMRSTRSHAKLILVDAADGSWTAAVGSCNWLSTPFQSVETTVVLRDPHLVSDVTTALQRLVGRHGLSDDIATEMKIASRELGLLPAGTGEARLTVVLGGRHDELMREATGGAATRVFVGCHRLGSTARPGVVLQAEAAVRRADVDVTLLYSRSSGPLRNRQARKLAEEALENGVKLIKATTVQLHGKYVGWDDDDLIVTSLNWASAASDADFPHGEIGIHVNARGVAASARGRIEALFPEVACGAPPADP